MLRLLVLLALSFPAHAQFWWLPAQIPSVPGVPAVPAVPNVPAIPGSPAPTLMPPGFGINAPTTAVPVVIVPAPTAPITSDVILNMAGGTISGCKYDGQLCVHNLPVVVDPVARTATGRLGSMLFVFPLH